MKAFLRNFLYRLALVTGLFAANLRAEDLFAPIQKTECAFGSLELVFARPAIRLEHQCPVQICGQLELRVRGTGHRRRLNRNYADGYVHVDSSGNAGGQTWNWGYQNASQVQGNTLTMHSASVTGNGTIEPEHRSEHRI